LIVGVPKETAALERRVSIVPETVSKLGTGVTVSVEKGAGESAGFPDSDYTAAGATIASDQKALYAGADIVLKVMPPTPEEAALVKEGATTISFLYPVANLEAVKGLAARKATSFAMELIPRISRAQPMDALSSQANIAGYKAVLLAADTVPKLFPLMMTAAGTISPAKVFILGAGVAGLQAIATAMRLGAVVEAYDVRSATREQVKSLGAKFVETGVSADGAGGYARELTAQEKTQQQEVLDARIAAADAVITTASVPGRTAPRIISRAAVERMRPGAVLVDIAAESGGNCELTRAGEVIEHQGVRIVGPVNLPAQLAYNASEMYARNLFNFLKPALAKGELAIDWNDEVFAQSCLTAGGVIKHGPTQQALEGSGS
jgi:NAD(P) transhydrogenase subunit alpha